MSSVPRFNWHFTPRWYMSILALLGMSLFISLGVWQLFRADEKKRMLHTFQTRAKEAPQIWEPAMPLPSQYQPIRVQGRYLAQQLLLDNQHERHQFGYHVISVLHITDGRVVLVDRGWVAGDPLRRVFPKATLPTQDLTIVGAAYYPSSKHWSLGTTLEKVDANLAVIEWFDDALIRQFLHKSLYPFIIRLGKEEPDGYIREWPIVAMPPERHYAYAFQWFAIAAVVFILFIVLNVKRTHAIKPS